MNRSGVRIYIGVWGAFVLLSFTGHGQSAAGSQPRVGKRGVVMADTEQKGIAKHVTGAFDVKMLPQSGEGEPSRMLLDKVYHGSLEATAKGQMLAAMTAVKGSAGYVAIELVTGTLEGRKGTFVLQHNATMNRGVPALRITVVPDSGTGDLEGLTGKMDIVVADGKHSYVFDYTLPSGKE